MYLEQTSYLCIHDGYNDNRSSINHRADCTCDIFCEPFHPCFEIQDGACQVRFEYQPFATTPFRC